MGKKAGKQLWRDMHKYKKAITFILLVMLTGCAYHADTAETANIADTADTSHNRDSERSE